MNDDIGAPGLAYSERAQLWMQKGMPEQAYDDLTKALEKDVNPSFLKARIDVSTALKNLQAVNQDLAALKKLAEKDAAAKGYIDKLNAPH